MVMMTMIEGVRLGVLEPCIPTRTGISKLCGLRVLALQWNGQHVVYVQGTLRCPSPDSSFFGPFLSI